MICKSCIFKSTGLRVITKVSLAESLKFILYIIYSLRVERRRDEKTNS
jgi:hypothetical protein